MNNLNKINKAKEELAKEILDEIWNITQNLDNNWDVETADSIYNRVDDYIKREHLFKSDYTK